MAYKLQINRWLQDEIACEPGIRGIVEEMRHSLTMQLRQMRILLLLGLLGRILRVESLI